LFQVHGVNLSALKLFHRDKIMKFTKLGKVRIEQLREEIRHNVIEFPLMAIQWNQIDGVEIEDVDGKATTYQAELQDVVDAHVPTMEYFDEEKDPILEASAREGWKDLGVWSTWQPQQAQDYVNAEILNGMDKAQIDAYIDANITGTTIAQLRAQTIGALKLLAGNLITMRNILGIIAKVPLYIRDILIKRL